MYKYSEPNRLTVLFHITKTSGKDTFFFNGLHASFLSPNKNEGSEKNVYLQPIIFNYYNEDFQAPTSK